MLDVAPPEVTIPLYAATWRACLGPSDFSVWIAGATGAGKSELAALAQQHYGARMDSRHLPGSWTSTANALEGLASGAKDALLVIDDFAPSGSPMEIQRYYGAAERILRSQGNRSARLRMGPDQQLRPALAPRGLVLVTGEDVPRGHSLTARTFVVELGPGDLDFDALGPLQVAARDGELASAMAGFLQWRAAHYRSATAAQPEKVARLRQRAQRSGGHRRTPDIVANLAYGFNTFTRFAHSIEAITDTDAKALRNRAWTTLGSIADAQGVHQRSSDPVDMFFELLGSAIATGRAHVATLRGNQPQRPEAWGWRVTHRDRFQGSETVMCTPRGDRVGWVKDADLYLDLAGCLRVVNSANVGESITIGPRSLAARLQERGRLVTVDQARRRHLIRRNVEGREQTVLHVRAHEILGVPPEDGRATSAG